MQFSISGVRDEKPIYLVQRIGFGLLLPLLALMMSLMMESFVRLTPFSLFYGAVALAGWLGGLPMGMLATLISLLLAQFVLIPQMDNVRFYDGDVAHVVVFTAVATLITALNHARRTSVIEAIRLREEMRALMDNMADAMTAQDSTGRVVFANRAAAELTGYPSVEAMLADPVSAMQRRYALFEMDGKPLPYDHLPRQRVFGEGKAGEVRFRLRYQDDGSERWIHLVSAPVLDERGKPRLAVNIFRDITSSVQEQFRLQQILDNMPSLVGMLTLDGVLVEANRVALALANLKREDVIGKPFEETYWWAYDPDVQAQLRQAIARARGGETVRYDVKVRAGENRFAIIDFSLSPIVSSTGRVTALLPSAIDITQRKRTEALVERYMERLKTSNLELQQFAYVASHDLQEPLRMVSSYLQLIETRYKDKLDDDAREFIHFAVDGANRMKRLIQDLLAYSRVEKRRGQFAQVDMNEVIAQITTDMALTIEETGTTLRVDPLPTLTADRNQMVQLLQNLIANAIKFRGERPPEITIRVVKVPNAWRFSVQDNGIGIDPQYHERIFVIFQRLHGHGKYPGTGIGLAICKRVVERHGGKIRVESTPGEGTTFIFTIADHLQQTEEGDIDEFAGE
jgi:PAS domain S-box-containing protein